MFRSVVVALIAVAAAATSASAGMTNLSGTVATTVPAKFSDDSAANSANVTGASNGTFMTIQNLAADVGGTWTVSSSLGTEGINRTLSLTFYVQTPNSTTMTATLNRIRFTDSAGNTATLSSIGFDMSPAANNALTSFTNVSKLANYSLVGSFTAANANAVAFDISFTTVGAGNQYMLDAVSITASNPEPATVGLFAVGALGLGCVVRRRARARARAARSV